jgi:predicted GNAT family acetyltransferase
MAHVAGNLIPAGGDSDAVDSIGKFLVRMPRRSASIVGLARDVLPMWSALAPTWGPARDERLSQPLMLAVAQPQVAPDPGVRLAEVDDVRALYPATVAMFTEEVGVSPLEASSEAAYRARLMWLIRQERVFCRMDEHGVVFKAEIAVATDRVCQIQGVWVRPDLRGRGVGSAAMAALVRQARAVAPHVSLYVNDYNAAAVVAYRRAGFRQVGTMASVHF